MDRYDRVILLTDARLDRNGGPAYEAASQVHDRSWPRCPVGCILYAYLGVEDGSSGLSPLGWIAGVFFVPGGLLLQAVKGSHGNADLPLMAGFSFCVYAVVAVLAMMGVEVFRRALWESEMRRSDPLSS